MARVKLSEFRAKSLLVENYDGVSLRLDSLDSDIEELNDKTAYIIKVDQGVKKRGKQGLIRFDITKSEAENAVRALAEKGYSRFIAEPMLPHDDSEEHYVSFERIRDGIAILYSEHGGVEVEENSNSVKSYLPDDVPLPKKFVDQVIAAMNKEHMSFVEINPLIIRNDQLHILDAAVLVDDTALHTTSWNDEDLVDSTFNSNAEKIISDLDQTTPAALTYRLLNPDASLWLIMMGGGASITIADEASNKGKAQIVGNYGEYSGNPSTEETYIYTKALLSEMLKSSAPKKALVIAGGVANFSDVKKAFTGVSRALVEVGEELQNQKVRVFVRRGGPNEKEGLEIIKHTLENLGILGSVHGSDVILTEAASEALEYLDD